MHLMIGMIVKSHAEQEVHPMGSGQHPVHANGSGVTTSSLQVTGLAQPDHSHDLDMASNAFDEQYEGCTKEK